MEKFKLGQKIYRVSIFQTSQILRADEYEIKKINKVNVIIGISRFSIKTGECKNGSSGMSSWITPKQLTEEDIEKLKNIEFTTELKDMEKEIKEIIYD